MMRLQYDKLLHFSVCFLIALLLFPLIGWWSIGTAVATGVGKEVYDWRDNGHFSWGDIAADLVGTATAILTIIIAKMI